MKKVLQSLAVVFALVLTMSVGFAAEMGDVEEETNSTASYVMDKILAENVAAEDYYAGYNDVLAATICMLAGVENDTVLEALDAQLEEQFSDYDLSKLLQTSDNKSNYAYALSISILYLEGRDQDVTDYQGVNLLEELEKAYLENGVTAYGLQYIAAVVDSYPEYDWSKVDEKLAADVKSYIVTEGDDTVLALWGSVAWASIDDQAQAIYAVLHVAENDEDVAAAVEKITEWVKKQVSEDGTVVSWGTANPDSTALAVKYFSLVGDEDNAKLCYSAMAQFKNEDGSYNYGGQLNKLATTDSLSGLRAIQALSAEENMFMYPAEEIQPVIPEQPEETPTPAPEDSAEEEIATKGDVDKNLPTGDAGVMMFVVMMLVSAAGFVALKREN